MLFITFCFPLLSLYRIPRICSYDLLQSHTDGIFTVHSDPRDLSDRRVPPIRVVRIVTDGFRIYQEGPG
jgi:hypothetical protein